MKRSQLLQGVWVVVLMITAGILPGCGARPSTETQKPVVIESIEPRETDGKTEILVTGTGPIMQYTTSQITEPLRLIVDITDANIEKFQDRIAVNKGPIIDITPSQQDNFARLEIGLTRTVDAKIYKDDGKLTIELGKPVEAAPEQAKATPEEVKPVPQPAPVPEEKTPSPAEEAQPETAKASVVTSVKATAGRAGVKVVIAGNGSMRPNTLMIEGNRLMIDIPGTRNTARPLVIPVRKGGLNKVRIGQHPTFVRVVLDLTKPMEYTTTPEGNTVVIAMTAATAAAKEKPTGEKAAPQEQAAASEKEVAPAQEGQAGAAAPSAAGGKEGLTPAAPPAKKASAAPAPEGPMGSPTEEMLLNGGNRYTGRKISLDLQDADLVNVLRLFADVANINVVISPDVKGKVTVRMVNIPWDQAMDIILKMNGLGYVHEGNILRIAALSALAKESEDESKAKESKKKAENLLTRIITINYSTAKGMEPTLKKSLSPRGEIVVDERTNTIIVKDISQSVDEITTLVKVLDKPIPQVMIESKIVEATLNFSREIGVQWGGKFTADAAHGNATGLQFPNSIGVTGGGTAVTGATPSGNGSFLVNMPAQVGAGSGGAIGFTLGSLSKALNLDLVLSALESTGEGKVISTPRVSALDNKEAKISQGLSIPYLSTSASGTSVQFIDALLQLTVTPHVTPDNKIFMKIKATKNAPDTSIIVLGQPSIRKNEAETEILLSDGETAVIGGALQFDATYTYDKVPFFGDLPLIGWLFRHKSTIEKKQELLIFITPRIVKQEGI